MIYAEIEATLNRALALVGRVDEVYRTGGPQVRRLSNQFFFEMLLISVEEDMPVVAGAILREPWSTLLTEGFQAQMGGNTTNLDQDLSGRGSKMMTLVPPVGFEPTLSEV